MDSKSAEAYLTQNVEIFYEIPVKSGFFAKRAVKFDTFSLENSGPSSQKLCVAILSWVTHGNRSLDPFCHLLTATQKDIAPFMSAVISGQPIGKSVHFN